jgi:hypothetical protein
VSLQTALVAEEHIAEGQFCTIRTDTEHRRASDVSKMNSKTNGIQNRRAEFRAMVNLSKEDCIKEMPPPLQGVQF